MAARPPRGESALWVIPLAGAVLVIGVSLFLLELTTPHPASPKMAGAAQTSGFTVAAMPSAGGPLVITSLRSQGPAERAGLRVGDRLAAVDRHPVRSVREADRYLKANARSQVRLRIVRDHAVRTISLPQPAR